MLSKVFESFEKTEDRRLRTDVRRQIPEDRYQKTDISGSNCPIQRAMPYALCPMPIN